MGPHWMTSASPGVLVERLALNSAQKDAVVYDEGPQLLLAGAGTGKTRVLTAKIAYLVEECGIPAQRIFAATFTNKAANEMKERVEKLIGTPCAGLWIGTFHSLCARVLRREAGRLGYTNSFSIYDTTDQMSLVKKVMERLGMDERTILPRRLLNIISSHKNACRSFEELDGTGRSYHERIRIQAYGEYQRALRAASAMDFDDLITNAVYLFRANPDVLAAYRDRFSYMLVDEYQDTNESQFRLVKLLAQGNQRIFVVGDDDQGIYGWRGARVENILSFEREFPGARVFKLERNYRSTKAVLDFANAVIGANARRKGKVLWTERAENHDVVVTRYVDDRQEAHEVAARASALVSQGVAAGDIAVLFRTNAQSRAFEDAFRKRDMPYVLVGGTSFYERKEVKDCFAYLRLLVNPKDDISCGRVVNVPVRGVGARSQQKLAARAYDTGRSQLEVILAQDYPEIEGRAAKGLRRFGDTMSELRRSMEKEAPLALVMTRMLAETGYMDSLEQEETEEARGRIENVNELLNVIVAWNEENADRSPSAFLEEMSLATDVDSWQRTGEAVNLMTLHAAKGLEFRAVFLVGIEEGLLPVRQNMDDDLMVEEERRLLYVGITRSMGILECSHAGERMRFGTITPMKRSRFLDPVPQSLYRSESRDFSFGSTERAVHRRVVRGSAKPVRTAREPSREPHYDEFSQDTIQYRMGQMVRHKTYGSGKVLSISGFGADMRLAVLFGDGVRRRLMAKFANLEAV